MKYSHPAKEGVGSLPMDNAAVTEGELHEQWRTQSHYAQGTKPRAKVGDSIQR